MTKMKRNLINFCAVVFSVCLAFAVANLPSKASADETASFTMQQQAEIREASDGVAGGLRFKATVNTAWLNTYSGSEITFGTLIFPAGEAQLDLNASVADNATNLQAVDIVVGTSLFEEGFEFTASLVFDDDEIKAIMKSLSITSSLESVKHTVFGKDFTAVAYAVVNGNTTYTDTYTTSMYKTAAMKYTQNTSDSLAASYLGTIETKSTTSNTVIGGEIASVDVVDYTATDSTYVAVGNQSKKLAVDENNNVVLSGSELENGAGSVFVFDQGKTTIINVTEKNKIDNETIYDYDAYTGSIRDFTLGDSVLSKVSFDGTEYAVGDTAGEGSDETFIVMQEVESVSTFAGIRAKNSADDELAGVGYYINDNYLDSTKSAVKDGLAKTINYDNFYVETEDSIIQIKGLNYWTVVIDDNYDLDYALNKEEYASTQSSTIINSDGKGVHYNIGVRSKKDYEIAYNVGYYKLSNNINMDGFSFTFGGVDYSDVGQFSAGGFLGYFDGFGKTISNFTASSTGGLFGAFMCYTSGLEATPIVKNVAIKNVKTSCESPVLSAGMHQNENRWTHLENIYVEYDPTSDGARGLMTLPVLSYSTYNKLLIMNNVLIKNESTKNLTKLKDADGNLTNPGKFVLKNPELVDGGYYVNGMYTTTKTGYYTGVLFGTLFKMTNATAQEGVKNVYVISNQAVVQHARADSGSFAYVASKKLKSLRSDFHLGGRYTTTNVRTDHYKTYGYASNETNGHILLVDSIKQEILDQISGDYTLSLAYNKQTARYCKTCGYTQLGTTAVSEAHYKSGTTEACPTPASATVTTCFGTSTSANAWMSPMVYNWRVLNVADEAQKYYTDSNGSVVFDGVKKYADDTAMATATDKDFSSFTGDAGMGYWRVNEGVLTWNGA